MILDYSHVDITDLSDKQRKKMEKGLCPECGNDTYVIFVNPLPGFWDFSNAPNVTGQQVNSCFHQSQKAELFLKLRGKDQTKGKIAMYKGSIVIHTDVEKKYLGFKKDGTVEVCDEPNARL